MVHVVGTHYSFDVPDMGYLYENMLRYMHPRLDERVYDEHGMQQLIMCFDPFIPPKLLRPRQMEVRREHAHLNEMHWDDCLTVITKTKMRVQMKKHFPDWKHFCSTDEVRRNVPSVLQITDSNFSSFILQTHPDLYENAKFGVVLSEEELEISDHFIEKTEPFKSTFSKTHYERIKANSKELGVFNSLVEAFIFFIVVKLTGVLYKADLDNPSDETGLVPLNFNVTAEESRTAHFNLFSVLVGFFFTILERWNERMIMERGLLQPGVKHAITKSAIITATDAYIGMEVAYGGYRKYAKSCFSAIPGLASWTLNTIIKDVIFQFHYIVATTIGYKLFVKLYFNLTPSWQNSLLKVIVGRLVVSYTYDSVAHWLSLDNILDLAFREHPSLYFLRGYLLPARVSGGFSSLRNKITDGLKNFLLGTRNSLH